MAIGEGTSTFPSLMGVLWRGTVLGIAVGAAQFAFSLPGAQYSVLDVRRGLPLVMLAVLVGVPVSGLVVGGLVARALRLSRPGLVALVGLVLSAGLAMMTLWLGVPHLTATADPGVWCFGAACAVPGYAAAALIVVPPWKAAGPLRCVVALAGAVAVVVAGSLAWLEVAYLLRAQTLRDTGVPLVAADIPGYELRDVTVHRGIGLSYVRSTDPSDVIDVSVRSDAGRPDNCVEARAVLGTKATYTCRDLGDRWVLTRADGRRQVVIAVHADAVVVLSGTGPEVVRAKLRTASEREFAKGNPGMS